MVRGRPPQQVSLDDAASEYVSSAQAGVRSDLANDGFQAGADRQWDDAGTQTTLEERVLKFGYSYGAGSWFAERRDDDRQDSAFRRTFSTAGLPNSFSYYLHYSDDETELGFYRGLYYFELTVYKSSGTDPDTVLTQGRLIYALTPAGTAGAHDPEGAGAIALTAVLLAAGILVVVLAVMVAYALWTVRALPATPPASPPGG